MWLSLETTPKTITAAVRRVFRCVELCPQALNHLDLHFKGSGNGPVVITWIGREHELYSGTSPISLALCQFRHDRRFLWLLGFVHNCPTSRWSATKKENRFSLNGNGIMSSFLGRQFYRSTLYFSLIPINHIWYTVKGFQYCNLTLIILFNITHSMYN